MTDREMVDVICRWARTNRKKFSCDNCPLIEHKTNCLSILLFDDSTTEQEHNNILAAYNKISAPLMTEDDMMSIF